MSVATSSSTSPGRKARGSSAVTSAAASGSVGRPKIGGRASRRSGSEADCGPTSCKDSVRSHRSSANQSADVAAKPPPRSTNPARVAAERKVKKAVDLPSTGLMSCEAPTRSKAQFKQEAKAGTTMKNTKASRSVSQAPAAATVVAGPSVVERDQPQTLAHAQKLDTKAEPGQARSCAPALVTAIPQANLALPIERYVGLDIGKRTEYCELKQERVTHRATIQKEKDLEKLLGPGTPRARVVFEACREGWYLYDLLTGWGHEVWMADTTRVKQLGIGQHKRKNDRIDAEVLARAGESGRVPKAHILSHDSQHLRTELSVRRTVVETRAQYVTQIRSILRSEGLKVDSCDPKNFLDKLQEAEISASLRKAIEPMVVALKVINPCIESADEQLDKHCEQEPTVKLLSTAPGVGRIVSAAFISVVDNPRRFRRAHQLEAYLGLVPSEASSGRRKIGSITKEGNAYVRAMLVQAAWNILRTRASDPLKTWALAIAKRSGKRIAAVALARRLAGVLWAMWRDGSAYDPAYVGQASARGKGQEAERTQRTAKAIEAVSARPA